MNPEAEVEAEFARRVRAAGGHSIKLAPVEAGTPDRLVLLPGGRLYLVELKTTTGRVSAIQEHWHKKVAALGTTVYVIFGKPGIEQWIAKCAQIR